MSKSIKVPALLLVLGVVLTGTAASGVGYAAAAESLIRGPVHESCRAGEPLESKASGLIHYAVETQAGTTDMPSTGDGVWPNVQLYWPPGTGPYAVVVYYQDAEEGTRVADHRQSARKIAAAANAVVIAVRTSSSQGSAPVVDRDDAVFDAYRWALTNASALGGDADRVSVVSESGAASVTRHVVQRAKAEALHEPYRRPIQLNDHQLSTALQTHKNIAMVESTAQGLAIR